MAKVEIKLESAGVRELLRSEEMQDICTKHANAVRKKLGKGYAISSYTGKNRVNASILAETEEAYREQLENNSILKAIGG